MINLLTPEEVKKGPSRAQQEQRARVRDLSAEENRLVTSINALHEDERTEKERIESDVAEFRKNANAKIADLDTIIAIKTKEVTALEARRAEAMKPIEEVRKEADERNKKSKERETAVGMREKAQSTAGDKLSEQMEAADDRDQELNEKEEGLNDREKAIKAADEITKKSAQALSIKWAEYHEAVLTKNKEMEERENTVAIAERVNETARLENEKKTTEQKEKDREIADRYATLERAAAEILSKQ